MDSFLPPVVALLLADVKGFKAGMAEARGEMAATNGVFGRLAGAGRMALMGIAAAALVVGAYSVDMGAKFDAVMERVHTQAGASQAEVDKFKGSILALAGPTAQAPEDLALSLYHVESAGFRGAIALQMVKAAAEGATIGGANLEDTTQAMIATIASGIPGISSMEGAMAGLNRTVGIGDMKMQGLVEALGGPGLLPAAKVAGLAFNDVAAALATISDNATNPVVAATHLRMTFAMMAGPSGRAVKALKAVGMSSTELAQDMRHPDGLLVALEDLKSHLEHLPSTGKFDPGGFKGVLANQTLVHAFGGGKSSGTIMLLLTQLDRLRTKYQQLGPAQKQAQMFQEAWQKTQEQFAVKVQQVKDTVGALAIRIGEFLIPYVEKAADLFLKGVAWLEKHRAVVVALGIALGTVLLAGLVSVTAAVIAFTAALVMDPVFLAVAAVVALGVGAYYAYTHFQTFHTIVTKVWGFIKTATGWLLEHKVVLIGLAIAVGALIAPWLTVGAVMLAVAVRYWPQVKAIGEGALHGLGAALSWVVGVAKGVANWIASWLGPFVGWWQSRWGQIKTVLQSVWAAISMIVRVSLAIVTASVRIAIGFLLPFLKMAWDIVVGIFKVAWDLISGIVKIAWDLISGSVRTAFAILRTVFEVGLDLLTGHWKQAWTDLVSGFKRIFSTIWDAAKTVLGTLGQTIVAAVKDFGMLLWNAGKDLITGLINGIKNMAGAAVGAVKNVGSSIVNGVKGIFHINSPSLVFAEIGMSTMEGLALGITRGAPVAHTAMAKAISGVMAGAAYAYDSPYTGGVGSGGIHSLSALGAAGVTAGMQSRYGSQQTAVVHTQVLVDGRVLFETLQEQALEYGNRNLTNGLSPVRR